MSYMDFVARVLLSLMLGFFVGLERQLTGHPAGIRINVLIALGTSFFTLFPMLYGSEQIHSLCLNIGEVIMLNGLIFLLKGIFAGFTSNWFTIAMVAWMIVAGFDVWYISKSKKYVVK